MKTRLPLLILLAFSFAIKISAQSKTQNNSQEPAHTAVFYTGENVSLPAGFPVFKSTGNIEKDNITYSKAIDTWIAKHPDQYKALLEKNTQAWKEKNPEEYNDLTKINSVSERNNEISKTSNVENLDDSEQLTDANNIANVLELEAIKVGVIEGNIYKISIKDYDTLSRDCQMFITDNPKKFSVIK